MIITDSKKVYPEFKLFKDIYTRIKISDAVTFSKGDTAASINLTFSKDSPFYILTGKLSGSTEFINWTNLGNDTTLSISDINSISKCLKKNAISVEYDNSSFKFNFKDKEDNDVNVTSAPINNVSFTSPFKNIEYIEKELSPDIFRDDLIRIYRSGDEIVDLKTQDSEILLELPRTSVLSFQPKSEKVVIRFTKNPDVDKKYVEIESTYENLTLVQLFATV